MEITRKEYDDWLKNQIGKECILHPGHIIKNGKWGNWCGAKTELGTWCGGQDYPHEGESLTINP